MAKNQDLSINFDKLNGVCGQIKCCIKYESKVYDEKRKKLPKSGSLVICKNGDKGIVKGLKLIEEQFDMITTEGVRRRYSVDQIKEAQAKFKMPSLDSFDYISDERGQVIGLEEYQYKLSEKLKDEKEKIAEQEKGFADKVFKDLFNVTSISEITQETSDD